MERIVRWCMGQGVLLGHAVAVRERKRHPRAWALTASAALVTLALVFMGCSSGSELSTDPVPEPEPTVGAIDRTTQGPTATAIPIPTALPTATPPPTPTPTAVPTATPVPPTATPVPPTPTPAPDLILLHPRPPTALGLMVTATGVVVPVMGGEPGAWLVGTPCQNGAVVTGGERITSTTVLLDPGHGGTETGAVGPTGLVEADVNLDVALRLKAWLEERGVTVALTRTGDYYVAIQARAEMAHAAQPELMLSIHHNDVPGLPVTENPGVATFYQVDSPQSERLGGLVQEQLVAMMAEYPDVNWIGGDIGGARYRLSPDNQDFYGVLRRTRPIVTVLSEAMYLSNYDEETLLYREDVRQREAEMLGGAIARYLTTNDSGSGIVPGDQLEPWPGSNTGGVDACVEPALE